jgi:GrpB-like predicted nucleotidyltransferase (UPF0157 family)
MTRRSTRAITVVDYDPSWPLQFEILRSRVLQAVGNVALSVEHVGSTSIPGLAKNASIGISCERMGVLESRTAGYHDLVCGESRILAWRGESYRPLQE